MVSGHEQWGTWRIPLGVEPVVEWRRRFLLIAYADGPFSDRKVSMECVPPYRPADLRRPSRSRRGTRALLRPRGSLVAFRRFDPDPAIVA
jgi:hypothetical protein